MISCQNRKKQAEKFNHTAYWLRWFSWLLFHALFLRTMQRSLKLKAIIALENFLTGTKDWLNKLVNSKPELNKVARIQCDYRFCEHVDDADQADIIIHMASIASPTFYRIYPIETVDANITGLRRLLDYYSVKN